MEWYLHHRASGPPKRAYCWRSTCLKSNAIDGPVATLELETENINYPNPTSPELHFHQECNRQSLTFFWSLLQAWLLNLKQFQLLTIAWHVQWCQVVILSYPTVVEFLLYQASMVDGCSYMWDTY
jgi:hypothetical protein